MAGMLAWAQARAVGGVAGMLQVGETSNLRSMIEEQLGEVPLAPGPGHDGQIYYAIGLDLDGSEVGPLLDHAAYRYRRMLGPALASLFGLLEGNALLWSQLIAGIISMACATGLVALMASRAGRSEYLALAVLLNPGVWLSVQLLTPDALSLALMLTGLFAVTLSAGPNVWFGLSGLAKDVSLATPIPLGAARRDWRMMVLPVLPMLAWMTVLQIQFGDGFAARGNLGLPVLGIVEASSNWANLDVPDIAYLVFTLVSVALGLVYSFQKTWLRWPIAAWTGLALVSSNWVWDFGNNAARAFAPLVVLLALASTDREVDEAASD
jgi:hypothetical protein